MTLVEQEIISCSLNHSLTGVLVYYGCSSPELLSFSSLISYSFFLAAASSLAYFCTKELRLPMVESMSCWT